MNRNWSMLLVAAAVLALTGCGGGNEAASDAATAEPKQTPTSTATATSTPTADAAPVSTPAPGQVRRGEVHADRPVRSTHPGSNFYEPDASSFPTKEDLDELLLHDNVAVVMYAEKTRKGIRKRLYDWTYAEVNKRTPVVVPDISPDARPVRARIATVELRCNGFDWKRLTAFVNRTDIAPLPRTAHG